MIKARRLIFIAIVMGAGLACQAAAAEEKAHPQAYLYLDAYAARFECLIPVSQMAAILGEPSASTLSPEAQQTLLQSSATAAAGWLHLKLDGKVLPKPPAPTLTLVKGIPGRTERPQPEAPLEAAETMVGFAWDVGLTTVPQTIEITWSGFGPAWNSLPVMVVVGSQSESFELTAAAPSHVWNNQGRLSLRTPLAEVPRPQPSEIRVPIASIALLIVGAAYLGLRRPPVARVAGRAVISWIVLFLGAVVLWPVLNVPLSLANNQEVSQAQAENILRALLRNTYRAFDQQNESAIYDLLERSIAGDLLQRIYLQTIEALTLDEMDKTRVRVTDLSVEVTAVHPRKSGGGFVADVRWTALGTVGHWGHEHQRLNRYLAQVTVAPVPEKASADAHAADHDAWKMVDLEVREEKRL